MTQCEDAAIARCRKIQKQQVRVRRHNQSSYSTDCDQLVYKNTFIIFIEVFKFNYTWESFQFSGVLNEKCFWCFSTLFWFFLHSQPVYNNRQYCCVLGIVLFYRIKIVHKKSALNCLTQGKNFQRGSSRLYYLTTELINSHHVQ